MNFFIRTLLALLLAFSTQAQVTPIWTKGPGIVSTIPVGAYPLLAPNGTAAAPSYSFSGSSSMGMYTDGSSLNFATGGSRRMFLNSSGLGVTPGTATSAATAAFSVARTNNNAAVDTGVQFAFTDTLSAAGFLPFQVLGGASATTNLFSVGKVGDGTFASTITSTTGNVRASGSGAGFYNSINNGVGLVLGTSNDTNLSRVSAGVVGIGTGAAAAVDGTISAAKHLAGDGLVTAPSVAFSSSTNTGLYYVGGLGMVAAFNNNPVMGWTDGMAQMRSDGTFGWSPTTAINGTPDTRFKRYGAGQVSLSKDGTGTGTNAGVIFGYSGSSGYAGMWNTALAPSTASGILIGATHDIYLRAATGNAISFGVNGTDSWRVSSSGHFISPADSTYDIGQSAATRPRHYYGGGNVTVGGVLYNSNGTAANPSVTANSSAADGLYWDSSRMTVSVAGTAQWKFGTAGLIAYIDLGTNIGGGGANDPKRVHAAKFVPRNQTLTDQATITWDTDAGSVGTVTLTASRIMGAPTNLTVGNVLLKIIQGGSGSYGITWNSVFKWASGIAPTLSTAVGAVDVISCFSDATNLYCGMLADVK